MNNLFTSFLNFFEKSESLLLTTIFLGFANYLGSLSNETIGPESFDLPAALFYKFYEMVLFSLHTALLVPAAPGPAARLRRPRLRRRVVQGVAMGGGAILPFNFIQTPLR